MAIGNRDACLAVTLPHEGGYVNHPRDPGGATNMGITIGTLRDWRGHAVTVADVKALKLQEVREIYGKRYWLPMKCESLPAGVDLAVFDFGVNSGNSRAIRYLQSVVGTRQTGVCDAATVAAVLANNPKLTIQKICAKRLSFMQGLAIWNTFKKGWSRRVADVEARAVTMWLRIGSTLTTSARKELQNESDTARKTALKQDASAGGAVGGGAAYGGGDIIATNDTNWLLIGGLVVAVAAVVVVLVVKSRHNKNRAEAYAIAAVQ